MKPSKITGGLILAIALLMSTTAFAASKGSMQLSSATTLNGKQLPAGTYRLQWEGKGPTVQVHFLKGKNLVATAPAMVQETTSKPAQNAAVIETAGGGRSLVEARFAGKKYKLVFPSPEAQAKNAQSSGSSQSNP